MRLRLDRYPALLRRERLSSYGYLIVGGIGIVLSTLGFWMGLLVLVMPEAGNEDWLWVKRGGVFVLVFFGVFPVMASGFLFRAGWRRRKRVQGMQEIAALGSSGAALQAGELSRTMKVHEVDAQRLLISSLEAGLLEPDPNDGQLAVTLPSSGADLPADSLEGVQLNGTWQVEKPLGRGGMGLVYVARHVRTGRRYALKAMQPQADDLGAVQRFEREAATIGLLNHANIVSIHDVGRDRGVRYLVMDLLGGETLEARLSRVGSLPWASARHLVFQMGWALMAAHENGVLHRDLKPANVFLAQTPGLHERAVLLDFGLALPIQSGARVRVTSTGAVVGTPLYMSPEQARGEPVDVRSDLFALAAVTYEMLTGAPPFLDQNLASVYAKLLTSQIPMASALAPRPCPSQVDFALHRALSKQPSDRFPDVRSFLAAIEHV
ncbi:MAG: serine/threonine-protein kinase [Polyangiaceae bacterium]